MAKLMEQRDLRQMVKKLGHSVNPPAISSSIAGRYYTDLRLVPDDGLQQFKREYSELMATGHRGSCDAEPRLPIAIGFSNGRICLSQLDCASLYKISIDIVLNCGFLMTLLCTEAEAQRAQARWRTHNSPQHDQPRQFPQTRSYETPSPIFRFPPEIRERIYNFAIPSRDVGIKDVEIFTRYTFPSALGDPTGFTFQLGQEPAILQVSRQIRLEALAVAYRKVKLNLDNIDDLIRLLVAIGQVGRHNVAALHCSWTSRSETASRWEERPDANDNEIKLPSLHVLNCVRLLQSCQQLRWLTVRIDQDVMEGTPKTSFLANPGLMALFDLRRVVYLEIVDEDDESLEQHMLIRILRQGRSGGRVDEEGYEQRSRSY